MMDGRLLGLAELKGCYLSIYGGTGQLTLMDLSLDATLVKPLTSASSVMTLQALQDSS